jgi:hypothetical protein
VIESPKAHHAMVGDMNVWGVKSFGGGRKRRMCQTRGIGSVHPVYLFFLPQSTLNHGIIGIENVTGVQPGIQIDNGGIVRVTIVSIGGML